MNEEISNEDKQIHLGADSCDAASGRRRCASGIAVPRAWHVQCGVLQVACEVWQHGCVPDQPDEAMEDENSRLKRMYADLSMQADLLKEALGKK